MIIQKKCYKCHTIKTVDNFTINVKKQDGFNHLCKACEKLRRQEYYKVSKDKILAKDRNWKIKNKEHVLSQKKLYYEQNKIKIRKQQNVYNHNHPELVLWRGCKIRARRKTLEFNLEISDIKIPKYCPILGIELSLVNSKLADNSPSIDRINSSKGGGGIGQRLFSNRI